MTPETLLLAIPGSFVGGFLLVVITGLAIMWIKRRKPEEPKAEESPPDPQEQMYSAYQKYWDALDECALNGDTKKYDEIRKMGWRRFGLTPSR